MENSSKKQMSSFSEPFEYPSRETYKKPYKIINYNMESPFREVDVHASPDELLQLENQGYLHRKKIINDQTIDILKKATDQLVDIELQRDDREHYVGNGIFIRYLLDKDPIFMNLLTYPPVLSVIRSMLGPQVQLMDMVARVTFTDEPHQKLMWHIHNRVVPNPLPPFFAHPHSLDALIYLDDVNEDNGPLCFIPGSHKDIHREVQFRDHEDKEGQVAVSCDAGDCIFSHSNLWHRVLPSLKTGEKGERRRVLLLGFMPAWFKREFPKGIVPQKRPTEELLKNGDSEIRELLGHFEWV